MVRNRNTEAVREIEVVKVRHTSPIWSELNETGNFQLDDRVRPADLVGSSYHSKWLRSIHAFLACTSMRRVARSALTWSPAFSAALITAFALSMIAS